MPLKEIMFKEMLVKGMLIKSMLVKGMLVKGMLVKGMLVLTLGAGLLTACDAKDACLDGGGRYDEEKKVCEYS